MRIRQVKPDFWKDSTIAELGDTSRLVYIGLWMEADDTGWFRLNTIEIAADLYPLTGRHTREKRVETAIADLEHAGRLQRHPCGHAFIPKLTVHQRLASPEKQVKTVSREHLRCTAADDTRGDLREPAEPRTSPTRNGKEGEGKEGNGGVSGGSPVGSTRYEVIDGRLAKVVGE